MKNELKFSSFESVFTCGAGCIRARAGAIPKTYQPTYSFQLLDCRQEEYVRPGSSRTKELPKLFRKGYQIIRSAQLFSMPAITPISELIN